MDFSFESLEINLNLGMSGLYLPADLSTLFQTTVVSEALTSNTQLSERVFTIIISSKRLRYI